MSIRLPGPIYHYLKMENAGDADALSHCFMADGFVRDEGGLHEGRAAIRAWAEETRRKYGHAVKPLRLEARDGKMVLEAQLTGAFPGSPITLEFAFVLQGSEIASLEIG